MAARRKVDLAVVLADAETFGDEEAAKRWKVSSRSIRRYRVKMSKCPELSGLTEAKRKILAGDWLDAAKKARAKVLARGLKLSESCEDLRDVAGFLKILNDAVVADEMLLGKRNPESSGTPVPAEKGREVQGGDNRVGGVIQLRRVAAAE